ncbi:MAG: hypothetical protein R3Y63_13565 [Eubacteriales bacterium]
MADFEEDYQEPFYQEVVAEESEFFPVFSRGKKYRFIYFPLLVQTLLLVFTLTTNGNLLVPLVFGDLLLNHWFFITVIFFITMFFVTCMSMKKREKTCYKLALPNLVIQTEYFLVNIVLFAIFYSSDEYIGNLLLVIIVANVAYPVIPTLIGILFVIGYIVDKRIAKKQT